jgi:hypothetical protein
VVRYFLECEATLVVAALATVDGRYGYDPGRVVMDMEYPVFVGVVIARAARVGMVYDEIVDYVHFLC